MSGGLGAALIRGLKLRSIQSANAELEKLQLLDDRIEHEICSLSKVFKNPATNSECILFVILLHSSMENSCRIFKQYLLCEYAAGRLFLSKQEINFLESHDIRIKNNGDIEVVNRRASIETDLSCVIKILIRTKLIKSNPRNLNEWKSIALAAKIRNRIVHPKVESDLDLSQSDLNTCLEGWMLVESVAIDYFKNTSVRLNKKLDSVRENYIHGE